MESINLIILVAAALLLVSIFTSLISFRIGAPLLLIFLGVGLAAGEDGIGGIDFDNTPAAFLIGSVALAIILFESGFDTRFSSYRAAAWPALTLATAGVVATTALVGTAARYALGLPWQEALLVGAIVSSTDAAAVFFLLRVGGITLRDRVRSTLEIESGTNDPMSIFLTIALVELIAAGGAESPWDLLLMFATQIGGGVLFGLAGGWLLILAINRIRLEQGLYPVVSLSLALFIFAVAGTLGGSGFLAVYVAGLIAGNAKLRGAQSLRRFHNGLTWLSQIVMFVMLGLLATPSQFPELLAPAALLALVLILVARPLAVWLCLAPFRFTANETTFIAWVGLRGAVSILLAIVPTLFGLPDGQTYFNIAFLIVLMSLLVQGWTIRPLAHWLKLIVPPRIGPVDRVELELPGQADYELVAYTIREHSPVVTGHRLPRWARPSLIIRDGQVQTVHTVRHLQAGDLVYLFTAPSRVALLDRLFGETRELAEDDRQFFGDLSLKADITVGALAELYGLPLSVRNAKLTLADLFRQEFRDSVEVGDRLRMGSVELIARDMDEGRLLTVGLALEPATPTAGPRIPVIPRPGDLLHALEAARSRFYFRLWQRRQRRQARRAERRARRALKRSGGDRG
ncbi:potassium/proton antiporter [Skermanella sp. TT6]|uniref:Potassium/proton antiporter n=1 Tax=Skermanella cutis TaxID=2775420 RepID=A0ABX7B001_9PROT|nr:potassium/proton antiporter [Skermanella sp. TT6]QQP87665.1 potassium/proton antiporter [Skermanella sp. TT6]